MLEMKARRRCSQLEDLAESGGEGRSYFPPGNATLLQLGGDQLFFVGITSAQFDGGDFFFS